MAVLNTSSRQYMNEPPGHRQWWIFVYSSLHTLTAVDVSDSLHKSGWC